MAGGTEGPSRSRRALPAGEWVPRGRAGHGTVTVLKYKPPRPVVRSIRLGRDDARGGEGGGTTPAHPREALPQTTRGRRRRQPPASPPGAAAARLLPGYRVPLSWHSPIDSINVPLEAWISPHIAEEALSRAFPVERGTFVSFVSFYNHRPQYTRALGQQLDPRQAHGLHRHLWVNHTGGPEGLFSLPALEDMANVGRWPDADAIHAVYPNHFPWSPETVCRNARRRMHRHNTQLVNARPVAPKPKAKASPQPIPTLRALPVEGSNDASWSARVRDTWIHVLPDDEARVMAHGSRVPWAWGGEGRGRSCPRSSGAMPGGHDVRGRRLGARQDQDPDVRMVQRPGTPRGRPRVSVRAKEILAHTAQGPPEGGSWVPAPRRPIRSHPG